MASVINTGIIVEKCDYFAQSKYVYSSTRRYHSWSRAAIALKNVQLWEIFFRREVHTEVFGWDIRDFLQATKRRRI